MSLNAQMKKRTKVTSADVGISPDSSKRGLYLCVT